MTAAALEAPRCTDVSGAARRERTASITLPATTAKSSDKADGKQQPTANPRYSVEQQSFLNDAEFQKRRKASPQQRGLSKLGSRLAPPPEPQTRMRSSLSTPSSAPPPTRVQVREGDLQPVWIDGQLMLLRRVRVNDRPFVQGCWLDFAAIKSWLLSEVQDLLPGADLVPTPRDDPTHNGSRMMASAPIRLDLGAWVAPSRLPSSPVRHSLWIAWGSLVLAVAAVIVLLKGPLTLSERRGAFVSAVTHELRTPLTTFRM